MGRSSQQVTGSGERRAWLSKVHGVASSGEWRIHAGSMPCPFVCKPPIARSQTHRGNPRAQPTPLKQNEKNRYSADTCPLSWHGTIAVMFNSSPEGAPS
jgi:hypothetical protein